MFDSIELLGVSVSPHQLLHEYRRIETEQASLQVRPLPGNNSLTWHYKLFKHLIDRYDIH